MTVTDFVIYFKKNYFSILPTNKFKYNSHILFIGFLFLCSFTAITDEYAIKAQFIERFTRYIEWPSNNEFNNRSKPFIIGIMGESPLYAQLELLSTKLRIKDKPIKVKYIEDPSHVEDCHVVFICSSEKKHIAKIVVALKDKPILTISDNESFTKYGIMINMFVENNNIRFIINEAVMDKVGLKASYQLLKLAKKVIN